MPRKARTGSSDQGKGSWSLRLGTPDLAESVIIIMWGRGRVLAFPLQRPAAWGGSVGTIRLSAVVRRADHRWGN